MNAADLTLGNHKYKLVEKLYESSRTIVYRAIRSCEGTEKPISLPQAAIIKLLCQHYATVNELLKFRNQYSITKNLDIPGIIHPYSLEQYRHSYTLEQLLLKASANEEHPERLLEIVNQLNIGRSLICDRIEKLVLAELNLKAGCQAKAAVAYKAAVDYLMTDIELLDKNCRQSHYQLTLNLHTEATKSLAYLRVVSEEKSLEQQQILDTFASLTTYNLTSHNATTSKYSSSNGSNDALDFAAILKASQLLSSTIQLDDLLHQLTKIILQNSGAERCALIVPNFNEEWQLQANAIPEKVELLKEAIDSHPNLPIKLIQYVKRTQEVVAIEDLKTDLPIIDKYLSQQQPKSILCLPILDRGQLRGILYLENRSTRGVFGSDRILILKFLCTQAAISLENARLHAREQEKSHRLEQSQERLKLIVQQTPLIVIEWNTRFEVQTWNPAAEKAFGYRKEEVLGQHFSCIIPEEYHAYVDDIARQILTQHGGTHAINENITKDGQRLVCEWFNAPMIDSTGRVLGGISVALDISDRKRAEAAVIQKTQELEQALQELQNAQLQIVQSEKMASLGNLVAGVAHEINNPIGFLNGSINNAKDYVQDLLKHLTLYQQYYTQAPEAIQNHADDIDLEFLSEDLLKLLDSMKGATDRITSISTSLRTFSRVDAQYKVNANLHEGLDSTLLILKYRLKANEYRPAIDIIKEYGELPQIPCFPSQINQVFMNILANAIDVFDEMAQNQSFAELQANPQQITIYTKALANQVEIRIRDNGVGMTEEVSAKIFDHLFTTKAIGKGTGLGLAIARQIVVDKHNGALSVYSTLGRGTEFTILLPVKE